ncbi:DUF962 domain-containing protein [Moraxella nasovis]|uniref:Mpo1 family 2-hydroxy fatty acid dioxygenase n=1 Tax=Moraxella nasovis TaxID=2904121 RepID=UPI001F61F9B5|nr:Mpo1-like protein [Moraxella nasovis]UNU73795.1 DUF962 domain-containing protein [Moraxella nasovis]
MLLKSQKSLNSWLSDYAVSHKNITNKKIHFVCVPIIFLTIVAFLMAIHYAVMMFAAVLVLWFYLRLSKSLFLAMAFFMGICVAIVHLLALPLWIWIMIFILAWIGQFIGHKIEGAKPSFFQDLQFLLIGPAWVALSVSRTMPKLVKET